MTRARFRLPLPRPVRAVAASRRGQAVAVVVLAAAVTGAVLATGTRDAYPLTRVVQDSGLAWVASDRIGALTLLDGVAGQAVVNIQVRQAAGPLEAGQSGTAGYALDPAAGRLTRVDGSTYAARTVQAALAGAGASARLLAGPATTDVEDGSGDVLSVYTAATLRTARQAVMFPEEPGDAEASADPAVLDSAGRAWVLDRGTGRLAWFTATASGLGPRAFGADAQLVLAGGEPVVVQAAARRAWLIGADGSAGASLTLSGPGAALSVDTISGETAARGLIVTDSAHGTYQACAFATGGCSAPRSAGFGGGILGPAVDANGRVFVPDYTTGAVWVLDPGGAAGPVQAPALTGAGPFDLIARGGLVFYNDPGSSRAGTIAASGTATAIVKYGPGAGPAATQAPAHPAPTAPTAPASAPASTSPPPTATASPVPGQPASSAPASSTGPKHQPGPTPPPSPGPSQSSRPAPGHGDPGGGDPGGGGPGGGPGGSTVSCSGAPPPIPGNDPPSLTDPGGAGVYGVAYESSTMLAAADLNGCVYLWDVARKRVVKTFAGTSGTGIYGVTLSPGHAILADNELTSASNYGVGDIAVWSTATGRRVATLKEPHGHGFGNPDVFSPDGSLLAADSNGDGDIYLWSTRSYRQVGVIPGPGTALVYRLAFSPVTGLLAAADADGHVYLWDTRDPAKPTLARTLADPGGHPMNSVAFGPDGTLAAGDLDGNVYLWSPGSGSSTPSASLTTMPGAVVVDIAFSPSGHSLAATTWGAPQAGPPYATYVWSTAGQPLTPPLQAASSAGGTRLAFSPDGRTLAVGDEDHSVFLWDVSQLGG